ncbi:MAG TPA: hypothetical protein VHT03_07105 [Rhizomicrobium sp.]|nr:hypothetical protein [Rhizomicrobium sp.]
MIRPASIQLTCFIFGAAVAACGSAQAKQSYACTFRNVLSPHGRHIAEIQVDGPRLAWLVVQPLPRQHGMEIGNARYEYKVLVNNKRGLAAAASDSVTDETLGFPFGANVIVLEKHTGQLRMGGILASGSHDILEGTCAPN